MLSVDFSNETPQFQENLNAERRLLTITQLPMFSEQVFYPDYDMNMTIYKEEAKIFTKYMKEIHRMRPYHVEPNGLIMFPSEDRWLRGEESGFLLRHYKAYNALGKYSVHFKT